MHVYKVSEWEDSGRYFCGDVSALAANSNTWWYACNVLDLTPVEYVKLLINTYHAKVKYSIKYDVLIFSFSTLADCRKYKNYINKIARDKNFVTY